MNPDDLSPGIQKEIESLEGWKFDGSALFKKFSFKGHIDAVKFVEAVSLEAISEDNYPEIRLSLEKVEVLFFQETEAAVYKSIDFAKKINNFSDCYNLL